MIVNPQFQPPSTSTKVTLDNQELKQVDHYKYLGETIDKDLSFEEHWNVLYPKLLSQLYVLRELKSLGFKEQVLVTVYKAMSLSLINYSAPVLVNTNNTIKQEIKWVQQRALSIIGIDMQEANTKYKILPILDQIDKECIKIITNIISDPDHPITKKLPTRSTDGPCTRSQTDNNKPTYVANHANTTKYQNSCLQKSLTTLTNGYEDKYTNPRRIETTTTEHKIEMAEFEPKISKPKTKKQKEFKAKKAAKRLAQQAKKTAKEAEQQKAALIKYLNQLEREDQKTQKETIQYLKELDRMELVKLRESKLTSKTNNRNKTTNTPTTPTSKPT
jgi:hypothetical protein